MSPSQPTGFDRSAHSPHSRRRMLGLLASAPLAAGMVSGTAAARPLGHNGARPSAGPAKTELEEKIRQIIDQPEFTGPWGLSFASAGSGERICAVNPAEPLRLASAIKQFIAATAFEELGHDHTFRTRVYATGPIRHGVLHGDLVLVAGGDLLLGSRVQPDGSIFLSHPDHCYAAAFPDAEPIPGDPLTSLRTLVDQVAAHGIRRITGTARVDTSLFRQAAESTGGMPITASPLVINDNIIDLLITPGARAGDSARVVPSPRTPYLRIVNRLRTVAADATSIEAIRVVDDVAHSDGSHTVTLAGDVPAGPDSLLHPYFIPDPGRFGEFALATALRDKGIRAEPPAAPESRGAGRGKDHRRTLLAELTTLPLSKQIWPMFKVSSNPHAANLPHVVGAIAGRAPENAWEAFEKLRADLFIEAGLDPFPAGSEEERYSADFFVTFLNHLNHKPYIEPYVEALGVMARDDHAASGHVFIKGGSGSWPLEDGRREFHTASAGYIKPPGKETVSFTILTAQSAPDDDPAEQERLRTLMREATWKIITTVYDSLP